MANYEQGPESLRGQAEEVKEGAKERMKELREGAEHYYEEGVEKARGFLRTLQNSIRERPIASVVIAACAGAGCGIVIGALLKPTAERLASSRS
jgi:ElaB/YqjD/DUF883 family membrane-anchored ribosome-binding protein